MSSHDHLAASAKEILTQPLEKRIEFAQQDRWIGYTRAKQVIGLLDDLLSYPRTQRMPNVLLVGDSGNGKSTLVQHYCELHPPIIEDENTPIAPVVLMQMPSEPKENRFWSEMLHGLHIAHRETDTAPSLEKQAISVLVYVQARMLIIDEIHNLLHGTAKQQRHFLSVLKNLSNRLKLPIVAVGTRDAILALHTDQQLSSRFEAKGLPRWQLDREFLRLLASFESLLPLAQPSGLASRDLAVKLHNMSGGIIGELTKILKKAAVLALRTGKERIDSAVLKEIEWVKLSDYDKMARSV